MFENSIFKTEFSILLGSFPNHNLLNRLFNRLLLLSSVDSNNLDSEIWNKS